MKRGLIFFLLFIFVISVVYAQHSAEVSWIQKPNQFYEGQTQEFIFNVINNANSKNGITNVQLNITPLIFNYINDQAWDLQNTSDSCEWTGLIGRKANQPFSVNVTAPFVNQDTSTKFLLNLKDSSQESSQYQLDLTILKDNIKPTITSFTPSNYMITKSQSLAFTIQAQDDQTGLKQTLLRYCNADNATNCDQYIEVQPQTLDLSLFNKEYLNYQFLARDNANNEQTTLWNNLFIDRQNPIVQSNSPENNKITNSTPDFKYSVNDNSFNLSNSFNSTLTCYLLTNNNQIFSQSVSNTNEQTISTNLNDGIYDWQIQCKDQADNLATSELKRLKKDSTGPEITITAPEKAYRTKNIEISIDVKDALTDVQDVKAQLKNNDEIVNLDLSKSNSIYTATYMTPPNITLGEYTLEVTANDSLLNSNNQSKKINLFYNLNIDLNLNANEINQGGSISGSGKVTYDNGTILTNKIVELHYPSSIQEYNLTNDGTFSFSFIPESSGDVYLSIVGDNQETYISTKKSILIQDTSSSSSSNGGATGNAHRVSGKSESSSSEESSSESNAPTATGNAVRSSTSTSSESSSKSSPESSELSGITGKAVASKSSSILPLALAVAILFFLMSLGFYIAKVKGFFSIKSPHKFHKQKLEEFKKN